MGKNNFQNVITLFSISLAIRAICGTKSWTCNEVPPCEEGDPPLVDGETPSEGWPRGEFCWLFGPLWPFWAWDWGQEPSLEQKLNCSINKKSRAELLNHMKLNHRPICTSKTVPDRDLFLYIWNSTWQMVYSCTSETVPDKDLFLYIWNSTWQRSIHVHLKLYLTNDLFMYICNCTWQITICTSETLSDKEPSVYLKLYLTNDPSIHLKHFQTNDQSLHLKLYLTKNHL